jgi:hypothetical protein
MTMHRKNFRKFSIRFYVRFGHEAYESPEVVGSNPFHSPRVIFRWNHSVYLYFAIHPSRRSERQMSLSGNDAGIDTAADGEYLFSVVKQRVWATEAGICDAPGKANSFPRRTRRL